MAGRHADVDNRHVGSARADQLEQLPGIFGLTDHVETGFGKQSGDSLSQERCVVGDHDAHGISTTSRVPCPTGL